MKRYDLMHSVNGRATFMVTKHALPHLLKSSNPHVLNISPPLSMLPAWFANHNAYTQAKFGMSQCVLGMSREFQEEGVAFNCLWPRTAIATAAVQNLLGGRTAMAKSRQPKIMGDAAYIILTSDSKKVTGNFFLDDEVLLGSGVKDFAQYNMTEG